MTTGCGTSEHAAMIVAALLTDALDGATVWPMQALELARRPPRWRPGRGVARGRDMGDQRSADGCTRAGLDHGANHGQRPLTGRSPGATTSSTTGEQDQSWCHTVGYLSPVIVAAALAAELIESALDPVGVRAVLDAASDQPAAEARLLRWRAATAS